MRGTYAKLNLIKNKLRSMGQKDPCVMLDDVKEDKTTVAPTHKPGEANSPVSYTHLTLPTIYSV